MLLKQLFTQNIGKRILISFFLFSFILTGISIAIILYSQYTNEKDEVITNVKSQIDSRVEFISEILWNMDSSLAELSVKSLTENPNIAYIAIYNEDKEIFTQFGNQDAPFSNAIEIPLHHQGEYSNNEKSTIGSLIANVSTSSAEQHVKDNFVNILLIQSLKSLITSFVFLFLIYNILIKHLNNITNSIVRNSAEVTNTPDDLIVLKRKKRNDELQLLADSLNKNQLIKNKHLEVLKKGEIELIKEVASRNEAEKKATHSRDELLYVLNSLTSAVFYCKSDGEVIFMNHQALKLLNQRDLMLSTTEKQQYLDNIIRFNAENNIDSESLDITEKASNSKFISSMNSFYLSNDGQALLTPVELTLIPTKQNSAYQEPNFIVVVKDKSVEAKVEELNHLVSHDYLTKIHNRMYLSKQIEKILAEGSGVYSLAIIDIDNFKVVNDKGGHRLGDQLLKLVAETISKASGPKDLVARIGGDEFAVLFNSDQDDSVQKSFNIITKIEALDFSYKDYMLPISCSIGITDLRKDDEKMEAVMTRADQACYRVKTTGKGSVLTYENKVAYIQKAEPQLQ